MADPGPDHEVRAVRHVPDSVLELLQKRCEAGRFSRARLRYLRKRWFWIISIGGTRLVKRAVDAVGAGCGLVVLSPLMLLTALAIKLDDRGPVIFWQTRVGRWGREFRCPKFRSMHIDAEARKAALLAQNQHAEGVTFKMRADPRITRVGRFIRKASIDELPQLWCVLLGQMSIVGPRPPVPSEVAHYTLQQRRRLDAIPGLTCFWQVQGRGDLAFAQQVELDLKYVDSQSLWLDIVLIAKTIPAVLFGRGAY